MRTTRWVALALALGIAGVMATRLAWDDATRDPVWPQPTDGSQPGEEDPEFKNRREAWIESLHRHAPEVDWRAQDAAWRLQRMENVQARRAALVAAGATPDEFEKVETAAIRGVWRERGSSNQAGRVTGAIYEAATDRLTVLSQGGHVWHAPRSTLAWTSANDSLRFDSKGFIERLGNGPNTPGRRLLLSSDSPAGVWYSDDEGVSYTAAGIDNSSLWDTQGLVVRDATLNEVYLTRVHYDFSASKWRTALFASSDRGANFTRLGFVGERDRVGLFSPRYGSAETYLLADATLMRIASGSHALQTVGTVPMNPPVAQGDRVTLAGGVFQNQVFLYAFRSRAASDRTDVYRSLDGGATWQVRAPIPSRLFGPDSTESSPRNPNFVYAGGVDLYRTNDGGNTWSVVNEWGEYYANPATKLHADIPDIDVWIDAANVERVFVSTDGGVYESTDNLATVRNLSLSGLGVSQYYSSLTTANGAILAGSQDQGYQKALAPGSGVAAFEQTISGDYGHLSSVDGGQTVWMVYPGFVMLNTGAGAATGSTLRMWNFGDNNFTGALWMPPLMADPTVPNSALLAGGMVGASGNRLVRVTWNGSAFTVAQNPFDFGSPLTAIALSATAPTVRYAMNTDGRFFLDRGNGAGWSNTHSGLPQNHYFYGHAIHSDPVRANTLYVAGSGYSNPPVFVSTDNGLNFQPMATGLPNTMVYALASSPDGRHLFAATEVGPFYFQRGAGRWIDIGGLAAPDLPYWDVDVIVQNGIATARFATHGRGIWDFSFPADTIFTDGFER